MREETLSGCKVVVPSINRLDRCRFFEARGRLVEAGAITTVVPSTRYDLIRSVHPSNGFCTPADRHVDNAHPASDALLPLAPVADPKAVFVAPQAADLKSFFDLGWPIASVGRDRRLLVHRDNTLEERLKLERLLPSVTVLSKTTFASSAVSIESYEARILPSGHGCHASFLRGRPPSIDRITRSAFERERRL